MLSQKDIEEASAMLRESMANHRPVKRRTYAEYEEEERRLHEDPYGCGGSFGRWLIAERKAKDLAARKKVEPLVNPKGRRGLRQSRNGPRVPFETILGTIQHGAWRSPDEMAKAYSRPRAWAMQFRAVAIAQGYITKEEWKAAFSEPS
ncbi:MAG: hypothetical protein HRU82_18740 [Nitrospira sp.]|nr:MAG: hypothetical protein HRU82_18740 [Nitrospira sp.]